MIRPDWRTVTRPRTPTGGADVVALAADVGTCSHGRTADLYEPVVLLGSRVVVQEPDGSRHVDLTGTEWHPQHCLSSEPAPRP